MMTIQEYYYTKIYKEGFPHFKDLDGNFIELLAMNLSTSEMMDRDLKERCIAKHHITHIHILSPL